MLRFAGLALVAGSLLPVAARAQAAPANEQGYAFCTVTDTTRTPVRIWASPVLMVEFADDDPGGLVRGRALESEFLVHVGTLGGQGVKNCITTTSQAEADAFRTEELATWDRRMYFRKIGDWLDVAWTPKPWQPVAATAAAAPVTAYFLCSATQTDLPDRSDRSRTVASGVFAMPLAGADVQAARYEQAQAYTREFQAGVVQPHGLPVQGSCMPYDTLGEAQYAYQQLLRFAKGINQKYTEVAWMPSGRTPAASAASVSPAAAAPAAKGALGLRIDAVSAKLARGLGLASAQGAWVVEVLPGSAAQQAGIKPMDVLLEIAGQTVGAPTDVTPIVARLHPGFRAPVRVWRERKLQDFDLVIPAPATATTAAAPASASAASAVAAEPALYCAAFFSREKPALSVNMPVHRQASPVYTPASATATLVALTAAVQQAYAGKWADLSQITCQDNDAVHAGEKVCSANAYSRSSGGGQMAMLFCNASREKLDARWAFLVKSGGQAQVLPWPGGD